MLRQTFGDEGFTPRWHHAADCGADHVQVARGESGEKSQVARCASTRRCRHFSFGCSISRRLAAHSCRLRHVWQSIHIGAHIHFALIAWRARLLPAAERRVAGAGGLATTARTGCQRHSGHHPRLIGNTDTRSAQVFAVCAGNRFIASAGTSIFGTRGPTRMRCGIAPAWSHGNSGVRPVITRDFSGACKPGAAAKPEDAFQCSAPCAECCDAQGACSARVL